MVVTRLQSKRKLSTTASDTDAKAKHRRTYSGELAKTQITEFVQQIFELKGTIVELRKKDNYKWDNIGEIQELEAQVEMLLKDARELQRLHQKDKDFDVKVYSFSHVTDEILRKRFGVLLLEVDTVEADSTAAFFVEISDRCAQEHGSRLVPELLKTVEAWDLAPFATRFHFLLKILNLSAEASHRIIIDHCIVESIYLCHTIAPGFETILYTEMNIADVPDATTLGSEAVMARQTRFHREKNVTYLSGTTDYFQWTILPSDALEAYEDIQVTRTSMGPPLNSTGWLYRTFQFGSTVLYEAKTIKGNLSSHLPQVMAESLAACEHSKSTYMSFCLTSGKEWVFGVIEGATPMISQPKCWVAKPFILDTQTSTGELKSFMTALILWSLQPPSVLGSALQHVPIVGTAQ